MNRMTELRMLLVEEMLLVADQTALTLLAPTECAKLAVKLKKLSHQ